MTIKDFSNDLQIILKRIESETSPADREWEKCSILKESGDYLDFIATVTNQNRDAIRSAISDFQNDPHFKSVFQERLAAFEKDDTIAHGDIRFHSVTLYTFVRLLRPRLIVETGVASGKSSTMILLALHHNGDGRMVSIDLPNAEGHTLPDGALTHTGTKRPGWLVPDYLAERWTLLLGDSRELLPQAVSDIAKIDMFFHDSLHTNEHVAFEISTVLPRLARPALVVVDDADMVQQALMDFCGRNALTGAQYKNLFGVRLTS